MDPIQFWNALQAIWNAPNNLFGTGILGLLEPILVQFMKQTPLELTSTNAVVIDIWGTILAIANAFFLLLIITGVIQMMISNSTGTLSIPLSQFVPKIIVTGLLMNLSYFFGQDLLIFNNLLCGEVNANLDAFFNIINAGSRLTMGQGFVLSFATFVLLNIGILRLLFQAFERLGLWILLFVLGPLAFLCTFLPLTAPVFSFWGRMFVTVTFTQFVQFLALGLAIALMTSAGQNGLVGYLMATAMLFLVAKVPTLLSRFPSTAGTTVQGIGNLISEAMIAARFLAG